VAKKDDREDKYSKWIQEGKSHLKANSENWPKWLGYLSNKATTVPADQHVYSVFLNLIWNNLQNLRPSLYFKNPNFRAKVRPGADRSVPLNANYSCALSENLLHYYMQETGQKDEFKIALVEALMINMSYHKQGYHIPTVKIEKKKAALAKIKDGLGDVDKDISEGLKSLEPQDAQALTLDDSPDKETWWGKWVSAWDVLVPYGYGSKLSNCPWVIHRIPKRRDDAVGSYPKPKDRDIKPTYKLPFNGEEVPNDCYEIFEIWDWEAKKVVYTVPDKGNQVILKEIDWPAGLEKYPIHELKFSETPGQFYSMPDAEFIAPISDSINEVMNNAMGYLARMKAMYTLPGGAEVEARAEQALLTPKDGKVIGGLVGLELLPVPQIPQDSYAIINRLIGFFDQMAGVTEYQRGGPTKDRTATEANYLQTGLQIRLDERRDTLEDWLGKIGHTAFRVIQKNMSSPLMVELAPQEMKMFGLRNPWVKIDQDTLNADMSIWVIAGSTQKEDSQARAQRVEKWANISSKLPFVDQKYIYKIYSREAIGIPEEEIERSILPEVDPDAEGLAKAENMMAMQGMKLSPPAAGESHQIHIGIHGGLMSGMDIQQMQTQLEQMKQQALMYMQANVPMANDLRNQIMQLEQRIQIVPMATQQIQAHLQAHQQLLANSGMKPIDYNTMAEKPQATNVTPAESAGAPMGGM